MSIVILSVLREINQFRLSLALYRRVLPYVRLELALLLITTGIMLGATAMTLAMPWPMQVIVDSVLGSEPAPSWITLFAGNPGTIALLVLAVALLFGARLVGHLLSLGQNFYSQLLGQRLVLKLRCDLYGQLQRLSLRFHDRSSVGDLIYRITGDAAALQDIVIYGLLPLIIQLIMIAAITGMIFFLNVQLGLVAVSLVPILFVWTVWFSQRVRDRSRELSSTESGLYTKVAESLGSIRAVKSFAMEEEELASFEKRARASQNSYVRMITTGAAGSQVTNSFASLGTAVVVFMGALAVLHGDLTIGELLVFIAYLAALYSPILELASSAIVVQQSSASIERVLEILDQEDEHDTSGKGQLKEVSGRLAFQGVSFSYDGSRQVLRDINLEVDPGEMVAFVGRSGAGKTTLLSLLLRFYRPEAGKVLLDGVDVANLDLQWLRRQMALVLQEPIIFSASLAENIAYGRPNASPADVIEASLAAGLHDFIMDLPEGYETNTGERGVRLSGGQRQRLSIARAFLKDAPILILDEPTSNLDATTEQHIFQSLQRLARGRTTLVIAHRFATVQRADRIVMLEHGAVVEQGTHRGLVAAGGPYSALYRDQFASADKEAEPSLCQELEPSAAVGGLDGEISELIDGGNR